MKIFKLLSIFFLLLIGSCSTSSNSSNEKSLGNETYSLDIELKENNNKTFTFTGIVKNNHNENVAFNSIINPKYLWQLNDLVPESSIFNTLENKEISNNGTNIMYLDFEGEIKNQKVKLDTNKNFIIYNGSLSDLFITGSHDTPKKGIVSFNIKIHGNSNINQDDSYTYNLDLTLDSTTQPIESNKQITFTNNEFEINKDIDFKDKADGIYNLKISINKNGTLVLQKEIQIPVNDPSANIMASYGILNKLSDTNAYGHGIILNKAFGVYYAFGNNQFGNFGNAKTYSNPQKFNEFEYIDVNSNKFKNATGLFAAYDTSYIIDATGDVYGFGKNNMSQLGLGDASSEQGRVEKIINTPTKLNFNTDKISKIAVSYAHGLALTKNNTVYAWGNNNHGQLGLGHENGDIIIADQTDNPFKIKVTPTKVQASSGVELSNIKDISVGFFHSLFLKNDSSNSILSTGSNLFGALGNNDKGEFKPEDQNHIFKSQSYPVQVVDTTGSGQFTGAEKIYSQEESNFIIKAGTVYSFGHNNKEILATSDTNTIKDPVPGISEHPTEKVVDLAYPKESFLTSNISDIITISSNGLMEDKRGAVSFAILDNKTVKFWGYDSFGISGSNETYRKVIDTPVFIKDSKGNNLKVNKLYTGTLFGQLFLGEDSNIYIMGEKSPTIRKFQFLF